MHIFCYRSEQYKKIIDNIVNIHILSFHYLSYLYCLYIFAIKHVKDTYIILE